MASRKSEQSATRIHATAAISFNGVALSASRSGEMCAPLLTSAYDHQIISRGLHNLSSSLKPAPRLHRAGGRIGMCSGRRCLRSACRRGLVRPNAVPCLDKAVATRTTALLAIFARITFDPDSMRMAAFSNWNAISAIG
jgi:hypothetical protein